VAIERAIQVGERLGISRMGIGRARAGNMDHFQENLSDFDIDLLLRTYGAWMIW